MERLTGEDRKLACGVLMERYKGCMKRSLVRGVIGEADLDAPTRQCGHLFVDLRDHCGSLMTDLHRSGAAAPPAAGTGSGNTK